MRHNVAAKRVPGLDVPVEGSDQENADIRVLVVDDHVLFRVGLAKILAQQGFDVVGEARNAAQAIELTARLAPDVVVMDLNLPGMSGVEATRRLAVTAPQARVLVLTVSARDDDVMNAIMAGASGYVLKGAPIEGVITGIRGAADGEAVISPSIAVKLLDHIRAKDADAQLRGSEVACTELSKREIEILRLMADGKENKEIAQELFISPRTVKNHISNILAKLHIDNRIQAAVYAVQNRIV